MEILGSVQFPTIPRLPISLCDSGFGDAQNPHLSHVVDLFNNYVSPSELISVNSIIASTFHQKVLSKKMEHHQFSIMLEASSPPTRLDSFHAASWLLVTPSPGLDLHLDPMRSKLPSNGARDEHG